MKCYQLLQRRRFDMGSTITLLMLRGERERALERAHEAFCDDPGEVTAWRLAAAAESLLDVLKEL